MRTSRYDFIGSALLFLLEKEGWEPSSQPLKGEKQMIMTDIIGNINRDPVNKQAKIDTIWITSDDLSKRILRVTAESGQEHGINLTQSEKELADGAILWMDDKEVVVIRTQPEEVIIIRPDDITQMGIIAHLLGNSHKPIDVKDGVILLQHDPVVIQMLEKNQIDFDLEKRSLSHALRHANFAH